MPSFLDRYRSGDRVHVWAELSALGERIVDPDLQRDAWAVATETMRRARANVETIHSRLGTSGYRFEHPEWAWIPATREDLGFVQELQSKAGPLPLSLRAWYEIVGSVWWTGTHPKHDEFSGETDPLVIIPVNYFVKEVDEWLEDREERHGEYRDHFHIEISPDRLHKADISGGPPYAIACGVPAADGLVKEEPRRLGFVPYLRVCFQHGGFPGFEGYAAGDNALLEALKEGLLDI